MQASVPGLRKWQLGLAVLALVTVGLLIYVLAQGLSSKTDRQTYQRATAIADKLNAYVDDHFSIPDSLGVAGVSDVPSTISYQKLSASSYKFCMTYKSASAGQTSSQIEDTLSRATSGGFSSASVSGSAGGADTMLYISPDYKAGTHCQTIKDPFLDFNNSLDSSADFTTTFTD